MYFRKLPVMILLAASIPIAACQLDDRDDEAAVAAALAADPCTSDAIIAITPAVIPPTRAGVPVVLDIAVTNPNPATCADRTLDLHVLDTGLLLDPRPGRPTQLVLASGATGHVTVTATAPASADAGDVLQASFIAADPPQPGGPIAFPPQGTAVSAPFTVAATPGCQVSSSHELMITSVSVVDDPIRTVFDPTSRDPRNGVWTFKHLVEGMARRPEDAPAMVEAMLATFTADRTINGFTVAARPGLQAQVLAAWPRLPSGALDLAKAPLRLQAIVNRFDLRNLDAGDAGEGRFVFAFNLEPVPGAPPPEATIIFEYKLPARNDRDVERWARSFHVLGRLPFGEAYNLVLQLITEQFVRRGARPGFPNGSAINAVRTNELPFGDNNLWELRELHLSSTTGRLEPSALELTPDFGFNNSAKLASYINANQAQIIAEHHVVPDQLDGAPFKAGAVFNNLTTWLAPGVDNEARHHFAINTCNGCHAVEETGTAFLHLVPRAAGTEARRSRWLTGTIVDDRVTGTPRSFDDLGRRKADLAAVVCGSPATATLRNGIRRTH